MTPTDPHPPTPAATGDVLPCPFCGGTRLCPDIVQNTGGNIHYIHCAECATDGPWARSGGKQAAIAAWNRRTAPEVPEGGTGGVQWKYMETEKEWRLYVGESYVATVFLNAVWHTWDEDGNGGENASENTVHDAKQVAADSAIRQGFMTRALETRLRAVTTERERALYLADAINELCDELDAIQWDDGCPVNYRELQEGAVAFTKGTPFQFIHQKQIETLAAERDAAVAERDGLRDAVAASMVEATKAKREAKEKAETIRCLEVILSKLGIPTGFEDGNSWDDLDVDERLRIFEKEHTTLRASLAAARDREKKLKELLFDLCSHDEKDHGICLHCGLDCDMNSHNYKQ